MTGAMLMAAQGSAWDRIASHYDRRTDSANNVSGRQPETASSTTRRDDGEEPSTLDLLQIGVLGWLTAWIVPLLLRRFERSQLAKRLSLAPEDKGMREQAQNSRIRMKVLLLIGGLLLAAYTAISVIRMIF
jgi:hypothetical protein